MSSWLSVFVVFLSIVSDLKHKEDLRPEPHGMLHPPTPIFLIDLRKKQHIRKALAPIYLPLHSFFRFPPPCFSLKHPPPLSDPHCNLGLLFWALCLQKQLVQTATLIVFIENWKHLLECQCSRAGKRKRHVWHVGHQGTEMWLMCRRAFRLQMSCNQTAIHHYLKYADFVSGGPPCSILCWGGSVCDWSLWLSTAVKQNRTRQTDTTPHRLSFESCPLWPPLWFLTFPHN